MQEIKCLAQDNMEKKNNEKKIIILCIAIAICTYIVPFGLIFGLGYLDQVKYGNQKYKVVEDQIYVEDLVIKDVKGTYYEDSHKYVITGSFENTNKEELDLYFDLYDGEGYIVGEAFSYIELKKNGKYRFKAIYEENDANEVKSFKIKKILCY